MARLAGSIVGSQRDSYVYAIVVGAQVYIGETGEVPPKRWAAHLSPGGTLCERLDDAGIQLAAIDDELIFVAVCCDEIRTVDVQFRKLARRAIEEELHRRFSLDPSRIHPEATLVSNMPAAPVRISLPFDPRLAAEQAYGIIAEVARMHLAVMTVTTEK